MERRSRDGNSMSAGPLLHIAEQKARLRAAVAMTSGFFSLDNSQLRFKHSAHLNGYNVLTTARSGNSPALVN